jgi:hypothetical protein
MKNLHACAVLKMWLADPRIPIELDNKIGTYVLQVSDTQVELRFCPYCGQPIKGHEPTMAVPPRSCKHLTSLSRKPGSTIEHRSQQRQYWIRGSEGFSALVYHCFVCGRLLPRKASDQNFYVKSPKEEAVLKRQFENIHSIEEALQRLGHPDTDHGRHTEHIYPDGKRTLIGHRRALFYERLAKTITVVILELLNGQFEVKFYPKARPVKGRP